MQKTIAFDTTFLFDQYSHRGIGKYGAETLRRLIPDILADEEWNVLLIGFEDLEQNLVKIGFSTLTVEQYAQQIGFKSLGAPYASDIKNYKRWFSDFQPIVDAERPDVYMAFHFERGTPSLVKQRKEIHYMPKTIVVAHDAIPFQTGVFSSKSFIHNYLKKRFYLKMWSGVTHADIVLTASHYSKEQLIHHADVSKDTIEVIHLGVDNKFYRDANIYDENDVATTLDRFNLATEQYLFYDSGVEANKGIFELIDALHFLFNYKRTKVPKLLVMTGGHFEKGRGPSIKPRIPEAKKVLEYAKKKGVLDFIQTTGRIPENELIVLLHNAKAHINFSKLEGFNLGPIQAMAAEVPAIVADASCNPEVTQGKAFLVNINTSKKIAKQIKKYLESPKEIRKHVEQSLEVAKTYTWDATSEKIWENIQKLV